MAVPTNRVPTRVARGTYANLLADLASIAEGEVCFAKDENRFYIKKAGVLTAATADLSGSVIDELSDVDTTTSPPTTGEALVFDGTRFVPGTIIGAVSDDSFPVLGGDLDVGTHKIVSASNNNIALSPDGNGLVKVEGNATGGAGRLALTDENGANYIVLQGPPASAAAYYVLVLPDDAGVSGDALTTDGSGNLSWVAYIGLDALKTEVAASVDFADFQARIAAL